MTLNAHRNAVRKRPLWSGRGQLTLVEHALCPLDAGSSLVENLVHDASFYFMDANRHWRQAKARVHSPSGLSATDEFYLWGLLALTFAQPHVDGNLFATPHYCLRQLGVIDQHARRGGQQYQQFMRAIERLSQVTYLSDAFYDPIRAEHRKVSFGFLSYSLPCDPESSRAWRARRKQLGQANLQYLRHESFFAIFATKGKHRVFEEEAAVIRDIRHVPLKYAGYSISYRRGGRTHEGERDPRWHAHVEIERQRYLAIKARLLELAVHRSAESLAMAFYDLPFEPYAPIRRQMLLLLGGVDGTARNPARFLAALTARTPTATTASAPNR